jgi:ferredoxin
MTEPEYVVPEYLPPRRLPAGQLPAEPDEYVDRVYTSEIAVVQPGLPQVGDPSSPPAPHLYGGPVPPPLRRVPARTVPGSTVIPAAPERRPRGPGLRVDWPACKGHGLCHELLPERFSLDEWGYPIVDGSPVTVDLVDAAKRAVASCPTLALRLVDPPRR